MKALLFVGGIILHSFVQCVSLGAEPPVVEDPAPRVLKINAPGKIDVVFWTVEPRRCTVQICAQPAVKGQEKPDLSRIQVWLLKADGTVFPQSEKPFVVPLSTAGSVQDGIFYTFPASAESEAIAVVVSIDKEVFVERL